MANADQPNGLTPARHYHGGVIRANAYRIASGLAANIFSGDLVKSAGTGQTITVCAAGDRTVGVFAGVSYPDANGDMQFRPNWVTGTTTKGSVDAIAWVYDDPAIAFEIQHSGTSTATMDGNFADITAATAGSTATGRSGFELDTASVTATTATGGQLKILQLVERPDNAIGLNAKVLVLINEHELGPGTTAGMATQAV